jgi:hypothetical protein
MWSFSVSFLALIVVELFIVPRLPLWLAAHLLPAWLAFVSYRWRAGSVLLAVALAGAMWDIVWATPWPRFWLGSVLASAFLLWSDKLWRKVGVGGEAVKWLVVNVIILLFFDAGNLFVLLLRAPITMLVSWVAWQMRLPPYSPSFSLST